MGETARKVHERRLKWYGHVMRREEHYVGRRAMVMKVQGRRKRGSPKRRWLDKVKDDIKKKVPDCRLMMCTTVLHGGICHRTSTPHKSENKVKRKEEDSSLVFYYIWFLEPNRLQVDQTSKGVVHIIKSTYFLALM